MNIKNSSKDIDMKDLEAFEQSQKISLPEAYKSFMVRHNGGTIVGNDEEESAPRMLNSIKHKEYPYTVKVEEVLERLIKKGSIPEGFIPVGTNRYGGIFCLLSDDADLDYTKGAVYLFYLDGSGDIIEKNGQTFLKPRQIANSFDEWTKNL